MEKHLKVAMLLIALSLVGLVLTVYFSFHSKENDNKPVMNNCVRNHWYDYIIEVDGEDSIPKYDIFDNDHKIIVRGITSAQLDSVIIKDNE